MHKNIIILSHCGTEDMLLCCLLVFTVPKHCNISSNFEYYKMCTNGYSQITNIFTELIYLKFFSFFPTLGLEERVNLEDGPSELIKSDLTNQPPTKCRADGLFRSNQWSNLSQP